MWYCTSCALRRAALSQPSHPLDSHFLYLLLTIFPKWVFLQQRKTTSNKTNKQKKFVQRRHHKPLSPFALLTGRSPHTFWIVSSLPILSLLAIRYFMLFNLFRLLKTIILHTFHLLPLHHLRSSPLPSLILSQEPRHPFLLVLFLLYPNSRSTTRHIQTQFSRLLFLFATTSTHRWYTKKHYCSFKRAARQFVLSEI